MDEERLARQALQTYREARAVLTSLLSSLELLRLLRGAFASGILTAARLPSSPAQIAAAVNMDQALVTEFCYALDAHGVFIKENETYQLSDKWLTLVAPGRPIFSFQTVLDGTFARAKALQLAGSNNNNDFLTLTSTDRLEMAKGGSAFDSSSPHGANLFKALVRENVPELHAILTAGGTFSEFGCGVAGGLLSALCAYPNATAVGVEIAPDLVEEARRRAVALGVDDRVSFGQGDAESFNEIEKFDYLFWSQFYFPPASRPPVLKAALRALKPGGILIAPIQGDSSVINDQLHTEAGQAYTRSHVLYGSWGIPAQSRQELQLELEDAGFEIKRLTALFSPVVVAQRPS